jgi:hypothetical protein
MRGEEGRDSGGHPWWPMGVEQAVSEEDRGREENSSNKG